VTACGDADDRVREFAVAALEDLGPPLAGDVASLIKLVDSPDALTAYWAITLLGRSGKTAADAVAVLVACVESAADLSVRHRAAWALGKIGPAATAAKGTLKRAAGQGDERLARLAKEALESIGG
jgi:HEAT repeat protein